MKPLTKAVRAAHAEGRDWKKDLYRFLLNYRATPHSTTGMAPSQSLIQLHRQNQASSDRPYRQQTDTHLDIQEKDEKAKEKMKQNADRRAHSKPSDIKVGETVRGRKTSLPQNLTHPLSKW